MVSKIQEACTQYGLSGSTRQEYRHNLINIKYKNIPRLGSSHSVMASECEGLSGVTPCCFLVMTKNKGSTRKHSQCSKLCGRWQIKPDDQG